MRFRTRTLRHRTENLGKSTRQASTAALGTRASANTSGPDFTWAEKSPVKLRSKGIRTERRKLFSSAGPVFELFERSIQPFDLMSRRHPLSSTRAVRFNQLRKANCPEGSRDVPASSRRQFLEAIYFFFLTRRVFFAVFFTALFAFFAFLAFLAMLPS